MQTSRQQRAAEYVPVEIMDTFDINPDSIEKIGGGLVNLTFSAETPEEKVIVQRLGGAIDQAQVEEMAEYALHLENNGWESPVIQKTSSDEFFGCDDNNNYWRSMRFIESDADAPEDFSDKQLEQMGGLLAKWHRTMFWLDHRPQHTIPHFHDTEYYATRLLDQTVLLPSTETKDLATNAIDSFRELEPLPQSPRQLIHGDPKVANMLFRDGKAFTFIDFDTVMDGPIWLDIGDMTRSIAKSQVTDRNNALNIIEPLSAGYFDAARPGIRLKEFEKNVALSTQHIALELAMRYLNDIVDGDYFQWDSSKFPDRATSLTQSALTQMAVFKSLIN